jgi:hypothetical protein
VLESTGVAVWRLPERIETPQQQRVLDGLADIEADYQRTRLLDRSAANGRIAL